MSVPQRRIRTTPHGASDGAIAPTTGGPKASMSLAGEGPLPGAPGAWGEPEVRLELLSRPVYLCAVRDFLGQVCKRRGFSPMQTSQIVLAVDEALANVMKHGYRGREDGRVRLLVWPFDRGEPDAVAQGQGRGPGLRIVVEDDAPQVDPATIKSRDLADVRPGGLGVHIIQQVMDSAKYERREGGQGMQLTLIKHLSSPAVCGDGPQGCEAPIPGCGAAGKAGQGAE